MNKWISVIIGGTIGITGWLNYWFAPTQRGETTEGVYEYHSRAWVQHLNHEMEGMWVDSDGNPVEVQIPID